MESKYFPTQKQIDYVQSMSDALEIDMPDITSTNSVINFISTNKAAYKTYLSNKNQTIRDLIAREIKIIDYAQEIGFTLKRVGKYYTLKEHDSIRIDDSRNCFFQNSTGRAGSVIDFALTFTNKSIQDILKDFEAQLNYKIPSPISNTPHSEKEKDTIKEKLVLPEQSKNMRNVYAYLIKSRYIDPQVVQYFVDKKMLYQDTNRNCVFVSYNSLGEPVFANRRGTSTQQAFKGDCQNCDYSHGFYISNNSPSLIITEAIIDSMSIMSILKSQNIDFKKFDYLSLSGVSKLDSIKQHIKDKNIKKVLLALDNDEAGILSIMKIKEILNESNIKDVTLHIPKQKDWNDELKANFLHKKEIPFFKNFNLEKTPSLKKNINREMSRGI